MHHLLRRSPRFFALLAAAAVLLRLLFIFELPVVSGDALFYGDLAKNWLQHGILGTSDLGGIHPSLIRLPGYPAVLAAIWAIVGMEHYRAVLLTQLVIDVGTCFLVADIARRVLQSDRAAKIAFILACLCPFTANYVACALTETFAIFFAALALDFAIMALNSQRLAPWAACGGAIAAGILLRPDGGILLLAIGACLAVFAGRALVSDVSNPSIEAVAHGNARLWVIRGILVSVVALAPLVPWTIRNWRVFHVFQPLAPRYANAPDQYVPMGFERWVKTWIIDYVSVAEIYWQLDDGDIDVSKAPERAFDSADERQSVETIFVEYNRKHDWTQELDAELGKIADARVVRHRVAYYLSLPAARIVDMWLRPRTEMIGLDDRWWRIDEEAHDAEIAMALGALNLFYVGTASWAVLMLLRPRRRTPADTTSAGGALPADVPSWGIPWRNGWLLLSFVVIRSLFLGTLENPEPRYTLECYPVVIVFAAAALSRIGQGRRSHKPVESSSVLARAN